jgi:hypothetical protein
MSKTKDKPDPMQPAADAVERWATEQHKKIRSKYEGSTTPRSPEKS